MSEEKKNIPVFVGTAPVDDEPVAYLDIGEGGYMDLGTDLTDDQLELLPKGRHMLAVIGTHGVHGYTTAPVAAQAQPDQDSIALDRLADYIADTWPMDKKYSIEEICKRLHGMWPGEFMPAEQVDKQTETQGKPVDESPNLQSQKQPVSGADELTAFEASGLTHNLRRNDTPGLNNTYADAFTEELWSAWKARAALAQQDTLQAEVLDMVRMLEANEWADHCGKSELGQRLEWAITALQNRPQNIPEIIPESAQQVNAERYRWLREKRSREELQIVLCDEGEELDAAIDAARKEPGQ